jgi:hypothetical protein
VGARTRTCDLQRHVSGPLVASQLDARPLMAASACVYVNIDGMPS